MRGDNSNWIGYELKFIEDTDTFSEGDIVTCKDCACGMVTISRNDGGRTFFNQSRFVVFNKPTTRSAYNNIDRSHSNYDIRKVHNDKSRVEAINNKEFWDDQDLIEIYTSQIDLTLESFPNPIIDNFAHKFKRTYFAVEEQVRVGQLYKETGDFRDFYYRERNKQVLKRIGLQAKIILDKLIVDQKI